MGSSGRPEGVFSRRPVLAGRSPGRGACRRRKPAGLFGYGARRRVAAVHMAQPGKPFEALFATCAGHAAERARWEGKISMSEPLLGEAGPLRPEPALADGKRAHDVPGTAPVWAGAGDQPQDGPADQLVENEKGSKRRRRGSRGGRGRRGAAVSLVDATESPEDEGEGRRPQFTGGGGGRARPGHCRRRGQAQDRRYPPGFTAGAPQAPGPQGPGAGAR